MCNLICKVLQNVDKSSCQGDAACSFNTSAIFADSAVSPCRAGFNRPTRNTSIHMSVTYLTDFSLRIRDSKLSEANVIHHFLSNYRDVRPK